MTQRTRSTIAGTIMVAFFLAILVLVIVFGPGDPSGACCLPH